MWLGHLFTISYGLLDPLKTATALKYVPGGGGVLVLNLIGQKLARFTYSFLHTSEYVQVADLDNDSVGGSKDIWKFQSPGYSDELSIMGE